MKEKYILAIDQGTSGTKTILFNAQGKIISKVTKNLSSYYPQVGFVEQNPLEIYRNVLLSIKKCLDSYSSSITTVGISNQRETFLLWDKTGTPLTNAIVWQCKRSVEICEQIKKEGIENEIREKTGLIIDPYFSGTKLLWLYKNLPYIRKEINRSEAYFGTIDTWLLYKFTKGKKYCTDYTNASRTLLFDINTLKWDNELLEYFASKHINLPTPKPSSYYFGETDFDGLLPYKVPISSMIGDSHAAAFGEGIFYPGMAKATLGTGSSILMNTGNHKVTSETEMVSTICWSTQKRVDYALEGIIVTAGATIKWLQGKLGLFAKSSDTEYMAQSVKSNNGVYLIPAFSGLGAPYWKMETKAAILNLTFDCNKNHIVRAALESIPFQIKDVIVAMESDAEIKLQELKVDGGITANTFVMQFLADLLNTPITNIGIADVSALGAAYLAGLEIGMYSNLEQLTHMKYINKRFMPGKNRDKVQNYYMEWQQNLKKIL